MNILKRIVIFSSGVAVGVIATYKYFEVKSEKRINDEVQEIRDYYKESHKSENESEMRDEDIIKEEVEDYKEAVRDYTSYTISRPVKKKEEKELLPYIIEPDSFGEEEDYEQIYLTWYAGDNHLADDMDELIDDVDGTVGINNIKEIGKYEDDILHIKNDKLKCYYEICKSLDSYHDL